MSGNATITARVTAQSETDPWALAGVMVRSSLDADSPTAILARTPATACPGRLERRRGRAQYVGTAVTQLPVWLRVSRSADDLTASYSTDGTNWYLAGRVTLDLPDAAYVGLAVTSHDNTRLGTATFDSVSVTASAAPTPRTRRGTR